MEGSEEDSHKNESAAQETERGVVFMTRVPPRMTVPEVRSIFSKIGAVDRIWLEPEDAENRKFRIKAGGSRRRRSKYGWIEFLDKQKAQLAVELLHNQPIGTSIGNRRKPFSDDLWSLRYLKGFKWHHLIEEKGRCLQFHFKHLFTLHRSASEWKQKNRRLNLELSQMARERDFYLSQVERANVLARIKERKMKKQRSNNDNLASDDITSSVDQNTILSKSSNTTISEERSSHFSSESNSNIEQVMHKLFGN
jgi:ESF2/ABP1 family protein